MRTLVDRAWGRDDMSRRWFELSLWFDPWAWMFGVDVERHISETRVSVHLPLLRLTLWWQVPPALRRAA